MSNVTNLRDGNYYITRGGNYWNASTNNWGSRNEATLYKQADRENPKFNVPLKGLWCLAHSITDKEVENLAKISGRVG